MLRELNPARYTTESAGQTGVAAAATAYVKRHFSILEGQLGPEPFLLGDRLSVFDIYLWTLCHWVDPAWLRAECPGITSLKAAADARPKLASVRDRHFG